MARKNKTQSLVEDVLGRAMRTGLERGLGGSSRWLAVGLTAGMIRIVRAIAPMRPETIARIELKPGERIQILTQRPRR